MEIIKEINEYSDSTYDGFVIITNKQEIKILICNLQDCCEQWGYVTSEDSFEDYIGAELLELALTDDALQSTIHELEKDVSIDYANCMFINANTSKGLLQFALYNSHNGYYGHTVSITSNQLSYNTFL